MDSITHAFFIVVFLPPSFHAYLPFIVAGALIPDVDFFYKIISDRFPSLYLFTHGGITHSVGGVFLASFIVFCVVGMIGLSGVMNGLGLPGSPAFIFLCIAAGGLTHLLLDVLAFPGIPLCYPVSDRKCTLGLFPGPSLVLFAGSILVSVLLLTRVSGATVFQAYGIFFLSVILARIGLKIYMSQKTDGIAIPMFNPFKWLFLDENDSHYVIEFYDIRSRNRQTRIIDKYEGISATDAARFETLPEFRRQKFYSYIMVAGREGNKVFFYDPLREDRTMFYPPHYTRLIIEDSPELG